MNLVSIYARQNGAIAHIVDSTFPITPDPDAIQTPVVQFDGDSYPIEYQHLSVTSSKTMFWDGANLQINGEVYLTAAWITGRQSEIEQLQQEQSAEAELTTTFLYMRQHLPGLKVLQLKLLGYIQDYGDDPDNFTTAELDIVYDDLKTAFAATTYWRNRLRLFIRRRAIGHRMTSTEINALFTRINGGTENASDKCLIWDAAETLIAQATTSALLAKLLSQ